MIKMRSGAFYREQILSLAKLRFRVFRTTAYAEFIRSLT